MLHQLQTLASERTALEGEAARLKKELADVKKDRDSLKAVQDAMSKRFQSAEAVAGRATADRDARIKELDQEKARMQELVSKFRETIAALRESESNLTSVKQTLATREGQLDACTNRNTALYTMNGELLDRLDQQSVWSAVARAEPFTKIKRVQLENLIDGYRARAEDQKMRTPTSESTPPAKP